MLYIIIIIIIIHKSVVCHFSLNKTVQAPNIIQSDTYIIHNLIYKQLKVDAAKTILSVMLDVSSPRFAPDFDDDPIHWTHKFDEHQR